MTVEPVPLKAAAAQLRDERPASLTETSLRFSELAARTDAMSDRLEALSEIVDGLRAQQARSGKALKSNKATIERMRRSFSWRLTSPLRLVGRLVRGALRLPGRVARRALAEMLKWLRANPQYKPMLRRLSDLAPPLRDRIVGFARRRSKNKKSRAQRPAAAPTGSVFRTIEADPVSLAEWKRLLTTRDLTRP